MFSFFRPPFFGSTPLGSTLRLLALSLGLWLAAASGLQGQAQAQTAGEAIAVPGSRVSLVPPEEFTLSDQFSGFFHEPSTSSIAVNEMPAEAYAQLSGSFKPGLKARGMVFGDRNEVTVDGQPGFLIRGTQELQGLPWNKWFLVFGAEDFTGMIVISSPQIAEMPDQMALDVLNSTQILSSEGYDPRADLGYVFRETENFELHSILQGNTANLRSKRGDGAVYVITAPPHLACGSLKGQEALLSEQALRSIATVTVQSVKPTSDIAADGLSGLEQLAQAADQRSGDAVSVYQAILFEDCRYYRFVGLAPAAQIDSYLPDFRRMTESFARK